MLIKNVMSRVSRNYHDRNLTIQFLFKKMPSSQFLADFSSTKGKCNSVYFSH